MIWSSDEIVALSSTPRENRRLCSEEQEPVLDTTDGTKPETTNVTVAAIHTTTLQRRLMCVLVYYSNRMQEDS